MLPERKLIRKFLSTPIPSAKGKGREPVSGRSGQYSGNPEHSPTHELDRALRAIDGR